MKELTISEYAERILEDNPNGVTIIEALNLACELQKNNRKDELIEIQNEKLRIKEKKNKILKKRNKILKKLIKNKQ